MGLLLGEDAEDKRIDETFIAEKDFPAWKRALLGKLHERVFRHAGEL